MEYLNVLQFINNYETEEEAQRVETLQEVETIEKLYNNNFNFINEMEA